MEALSQDQRARLVSTGAPGRLRSFDPVRLAGLEYQAWVGYYLRRWPGVLIAAVGLVRAGFGLGWCRTLYGAWLVLRANQLWAPDPDNEPDRAQACMRRDGANAGGGTEPAEGLIRSLTRLYCYLYGEPEDALRPAAIHRARAMDLSDEWVRQGCRPDSGLLPLEHAALVRCYAALLAAVHY